MHAGVKRSGREVDHLPNSSAEVKNAWSYTSIPSVHLQGVVKQSDKFTFVFFLGVGWGADSTACFFIFQ
jgi:hypothetical protein